MKARHNTHQVVIGGVKMGGDAPIVVQSMTNTDTADVESTVTQIAQLYKAGSEIVRVTVNNEESAAAIPYIHEKLLAQNLNVPIVGDFHYNGHRLLNDYPACAEVLTKYRINPGNVGFGNKKDNQFAAIIEKALKHDKPVRIGVNWGSLDQALATQLMDENAASDTPLPADAVMREALVRSALLSAAFAEKIGMSENKIVISTKVSRVQDLIATYRLLASRSNYPLHLGLTEAGMGVKGMVGSAAALAVLLQEGIGDTIRVSLTPEPHAPRTKEVQVAQEILQSMGLRAFVPQVTACPGCGRTTSVFFQELAQKVEAFLRDSMPVWREQYEGVEHLQVAVMGCIVNGPGESKHAHIGISLPGTGEDPAAPIFMDGKKVMTLRGGNIAEDFQALIEEYVGSRYVRREGAA